MYTNRNHLQPHGKCLNDTPMYCHGPRRWPILQDSFGMYDLQPILDFQTVSSTNIPCVPLCPDKRQAFHHCSVRLARCDVGIKSLVPFPLHKKVCVIFSSNCFVLVFSNTYLRNHFLDWAHYKPVWCHSTPNGCKWAHYRPATDICQYPNIWNKMELKVF